MIKIVEYDERYQEQIVDLILKIQNEEYAINLGIDEQPDLLNIEEEYILNGGNFWVAIDGDVKVIGTIALLKKERSVGVLKKFFVEKEYRGSKFGVGAELYERLLEYSKKIGLKHIILDTPSVATRSHGFYRKAGFRLICREELPIDYTFPDRNSLLFMLDI